MVCSGLSRRIVTVHCVNLLCRKIVFQDFCDVLIFKDYHVERKKFHLQMTVLKTKIKVTMSAETILH